MEKEWLGLLNGAPREKRGNMQRWFRFSGTIALVSLLSSGFPLVPAAYAEEPAPQAAQGTPESATKAADAAADSETNLEGFDPHDLPTPGKHQLRPTPLQIANHRIKRLNERINTQNNRLAQLEETLGKRDAQITAQEEQIKELMDKQTKAEARLQAMFDQIATVSREVEGIASLQNAHAARSARAAQQAMRGGQHIPQGQQRAPQVQVEGAPIQNGNIPRAIPVSSAPGTPPAAEAKPEPTVQPPPDGSIVYEIKAGDNLTRIARAHGTTVAEILKFNKITDERKLQIGQALHIPPTAAATGTPTPEATPAQP